jgi:predicted DCC family thiol-disulfide oxidoreductase YuxK
MTTSTLTLEPRVEPAALHSGTPPIIFFDGVCGLCNRSVDVLLRADERGVFRFAPLQGETARELLPPQNDDPQAWSMVYLDERGVHDQSDAMLEICRRLGGWWSAYGWLRFVPRVIRDLVYRLIARNRYRWFGKKEACRLPTPAERARFLP